MEIGVEVKNENLVECSSKMWAGIMSFTPNKLGDKLFTAT